MASLLVMDMLDIDPRDTEDDFCCVLLLSHSLSQNIHCSLGNCKYFILLRLCQVLYLSGHNNSWYVYCNFHRTDNNWFLIMTWSIKVEKITAFQSPENMKWSLIVNKYHSQPAVGVEDRCFFILNICERKCLTRNTRLLNSYNVYQILWLWKGEIVTITGGYYV